MTPIRHFCDFLICIYHIFAGFVQWPELVWLFLVFFFARLLGVFLRYVGDTPVRLIKKVLQASPFLRWKHFLMTENTNLIDESCWINLGLTLGMIRPDILPWMMLSTQESRNHPQNKTRLVWGYLGSHYLQTGPNWSSWSKLVKPLVFVPVCSSQNSWH